MPKEEGVMATNLSIHPRNWSGVKGQKKDTSFPQKSGKYRNRALKKLGARLTAWASMPNNVQATMRKPGSMKLNQQ